MMWTDIYKVPTPCDHNWNEWVENRKQKRDFSATFWGKFTDVFLLEMNFCEYGDNFYRQSNL